MKRIACRHCGASLALGAMGCFRCGQMVDSEGGSLSGAGRLPTALGTEARDALLDGRWRLTEAVHRSERGVHWAAQDVMLDRPVVVMLLDEGLAQAPETAGAFLDEAHRFAGFQHHRVEPVLAAGTANGIPYRVTRHAAGPTLFEHVHAHGDRLSLEAAAGLLLQLCEALRAIHARGLQHGDLRPSNVWVSDDRLTLAVPAAFGPMPFDAWSGNDPFALGVIAYELLAGALPGDEAALEKAGAPRSISGPVMACLAGDATALAALAGGLGSLVGAPVAALKLPTSEPGIDAPDTITTGVVARPPVAADPTRLLPKVADTSPVTPYLPHGDTTAPVRRPRRDRGALIGAALAAALALGTVAVLRQPDGEPHGPDAPKPVPINPDLLTESSSQKYGAIARGPPAGALSPPPPAAAIKADQRRALLSDIAPLPKKRLGRAPDHSEVRAGFVRVSAMLHGEQVAAHLTVGGVDNGETPVEVKLPTRLPDGDHDLLLRLTYSGVLPLDALFTYRLPLDRTKGGVSLDLELAPAPPQH